MGIHAPVTELLRTSAPGKAIDSEERSLVSEVVTRWREGDAPDALAVLDLHPELRLDKSIVLDLAYEEFCLRAEAGEALDADHFVGQFPDFANSLRKLIDAHRFIEQNPHLVGERVEAPLPNVGESFLGFDLEAELGRGAFARVFLAREKALANRRVVLKIAHQGDAEAATLSRLVHPNVVTIHSVHSDPVTGQTGVCMPYLGSATLGDLLDRAFSRSTLPASAAVIVQAARARRETIEPPDDTEKPDTLLHTATYVEGVIHLGIQLAEALACTHSKGVLHLDLKPSNVLLTPSGRPKLLDFNLSQDQHVTGQRLGGTLPYMSPEQLEATTTKEVISLDGRSDLFSLGVILYELLTGSLPFGPLPTHGAASELRTALRGFHLAGPTPLQHRMPQVDRHLAKVIEKCLNHDPSNRYASADELAAALTRCFAWGQRVRRWARRRVGHLITGGLAAAVLLMSVSYAVASRDPASVRLYHKGQEALGQRDYEQAVAHFARALAENPNLIEAWRGQARAQQQLGRFQAAGASYEKVLELTPDETQSLSAAGYCHAEARNWERAIARLERALKAGERTAANLANLGYCYRAMRQDGSQAIAMLRQARAAQPDLALVHYNLVRAHYRAVLFSLSVKNQPQSNGLVRVVPGWREDLELALDACPSDAELTHDIATIYAFQGLITNDKSLDHVALKHLASASKLANAQVPVFDVAFAHLRDRPEFKSVAVAVPIDRLPPPVTPRRVLVAPQ